MRIARFGDAYGSAYTFSLNLMQDSWTSTRTPIVQTVSGGSGAFDFYGANNFPSVPVTASKRFSITGTSAADLEDSLMDLRAATISRGRSKLWWLDRDDSTKYWSWAKCTRLTTSDSYREQARWMKNVDITFYMPEGLWYGDAVQTFSNTMVIPASTIGRAVTGLTNDGNENALLDVRIVPKDALTVEDCAAMVKDVSQWEYAGDYAEGIQLFVNASTFSCTEVEIIDPLFSDAAGAGSVEGVWGDGSFVYFATDTTGLYSYSVDGSGQFTNEDTDDQGGNYTGVCGDGRFIYCACGGDGLRSYSRDAAGNLNYIATDNQGGTYLKVWTDGLFIYVANSSSGVMTYSVDDVGALTHIDTDDPGGLGSVQDIWGDGNYIYVVTDLLLASGDLFSYSVDGSGNLTKVDSVSENGLGVWGDGKFIYVSAGGSGTNITLSSILVDGDGTLSVIDTINRGTGGIGYGVWGDGTYVYLSSGTDGIAALSVNAIGELEFLAIEDQGTTYEAWGDGTFVYAANGTRVDSYEMGVSTDGYTDLDVGEGDLLGQPDIDQISWLWLPPGTHVFNAVVDCDGGGGAEEVDVYVNWWDTYVF